MRLMPGLVIGLVLLTGLTRPAWAHESRASRVWSLLEATAGIREGQGPVRLFVFFDPNCPYCHRVYEALQPYVGRGGIAVRWIPVGILTQSSYGKAAALLEAKDPERALARMEEGTRAGRGDIRPRRANAQTAQALARAVALFQESGAAGVPFLVYRTGVGQLRAVTGEPPPGALQAIIARLMAQAKTKSRKAKP